MNKFGFNAANKNPLCVDEMLAVGGRHYVVICTDEVAWLPMVRRIRSEQPDAIILLRPYFKSDLFQNPVETAKWAYEKVKPALLYTTHIVVGNEFNEETVAFKDQQKNPLYWKMLNQWNVQSIKTLRDLDDELVIHWPAISPGIGDDKNVMNPAGLEYCRESILMADEVDVHCYWPAGNHLKDCFGGRDKWVHEMFPTKPLFLSECGPTDTRHPDAGREIREWYYDIAKQSYVKGICLFSWNWNNPYWNYYDKPNLVRELTEMPKETTNADWPDRKAVAEAVLNNAYPTGGIAYNPKTAFWQIAVRNGYDMPMTNEFDVDGFRMQAWLDLMGGNVHVTLARIPYWDAINVYTYQDGELLR